MEAVEFFFTMRFFIYLFIFFLGRESNAEDLPNEHNEKKVYQRRIAAECPS